VEAELEVGDHAEVAAAAAHPPEQLGMLPPVGPQPPSVGRDQLHRQQVVAGQAVLAHEPADAAAEREAGHAGVGHDPAGGGQPQPLGRLVELPPEQARLRPDAAGGGVDPDLLHRRQVEDQAAVAAGRAGHVVPAAPDGQRQAAGPAVLDPGPHVGGAGAARDQGRALVDGAVPELPRRPVPGVPGPEQRPPEPGDLGTTDHGHRPPP
jgi:hypothetical protein